MLKLPTWKFLKAETSTADAIGEQLGQLDLAYADADAELSRLGSRRPALLLDTTAAADAKLATLDAEMAAARRVLEATAARRAALEEEWRQAEATETTTRLDRERRDRYAVASKARTEGTKILEAYERDAATLAGKLRRLAEIGREIEAANADLPDDYPPIPDSEPFNGRIGIPDTEASFEMWIGPNGDRLAHVSTSPEPPIPGARRRWVNGYGSIPGTPGVPHRSLLDRVVLPALDPNAAPYWLGGLTGGPRLSADAAAVLRFHGVSR